MNRTFVTLVLALVTLLSTSTVSAAGETVTIYAKGRPYVIQAMRPDDPVPMELSGTCQYAETNIRIPGEYMLSRLTVTVDGHDIVRNQIPRTDSPNSVYQLILDTYHNTYSIACIGVNVIGPVSGP